MTNLAKSTNLAKGQELHRRAGRVIPGGVDSPVRAFKSVGGDPPYIVRGQGSSIWDADGNQYIDYVGSWGPLILGHAHPAVVEAVEKANRDGASFGACTPREAELAEQVIAAFPSIEKVRFVSSGTEASMSAIRLARAFTARKYIIKFEGCYHGHADALLVKAGSGVATLGIPGSAGVLEEQAEFTLALPFNSPLAVEEAFKKLRLAPFPDREPGAVLHDDLPRPVDDAVAYRCVACDDFAQQWAGPAATKVILQQIGYLAKGNHTS